MRMYNTDLVSQTIAKIGSESENVKSVARRDPPLAQVGLPLKSCFKKMRVFSPKIKKSSK